MYTLKQNAGTLVIHDREDFIPEIAGDYLEESYEIFLHELQAAHDLPRPVSAKEAERLTLLLSRFLEAKNILEE